jgi:hypothetical protein
MTAFATQTAAESTNASNRDRTNGDGGYHVHRMNVAVPHLRLAKA